MKFLIALLVLCGSTAHADLLLEPYLGYHTGSYKQGSSSDVDIAGVSYGLRAGYVHMLGFMAGVDYMTGTWKDDANPKNDGTPTTLSVFAGYEFPVLLRAYLAYGISNELKLKDSTSNNKYKGDGAIKLGVGFTALPLLSINLEYIMANYDEMNGNSLTNELESKMYGLTVSIPFEL